MEIVLSADYCHRMYRHAQHRSEHAGVDSLTSSYAARFRLATHESKVITMPQLDLITLADAPVHCARNVPAQDRARLSAQCQRILSRLQQGRATRRELTEIGLNATARISDLRAAGYDIRVVERHASGRTVYELMNGR